MQKSFYSKVTKTDICLVLCLLGFSGNLVLVGEGRLEYTLPILLVLLVLYAVVKRKKLDNALPFLGVTLSFTVVFAAQAITFSVFPIVTLVGFFGKLTVGYLIAQLVLSFPRSYVSALLILVWISLGCYATVLVSLFLGYDLVAQIKPVSDAIAPSLIGPLERVNVGIFNVVVSEPHRNSAWFWEPGAFAGYLLLGLLMLWVARDEYPRSQYIMTLSIIVLALVSTLSAMGLIVLPIALAMFVNPRWKQESRSLGAMVTVGAVAAAIVIAYTALFQSELIGTKILSLYDRAVFREPGWELSRFGSMLFDWEYIRIHPLIGWGMSNETRFALHPGETLTGLGNGLTGFIHQVGFVGLGIYCYRTWRGFLAITGSVRDTGMIMLVIVLALNGQHFLDHPAFLSLMFLKRARG